MAKYLRSDALVAGIKLGLYEKAGTARRPYNGGRIPDRRCAWPWYAGGKKIGYYIRGYDINTNEIVTTYFERTGHRCI